MPRSSRRAFQNIEGWESSKNHLTLKKALDYANAVHIPFGYLYLSSPPTEELPIPDLRRRGDLPPRTLSVNFRDVINDVTLKQQWFRSFQIAQGVTSLDFVGRFDLQTAPELVAADICNTLDINPQSRREASGAPDFLRFIVTQAERLGILVMRSGVVGSNNTRKLSVDEFSGFVMSDPIAPVIFYQRSICLTPS